MQGKLLPGCRAGLGFVAAALLLATSLCLRADDLTTLSGTTFRTVRPVRVEPDGITWLHAGGVAKVDFADSPESVRAAYHYDAAKATAYHEARVQAQRQTDEQTRQLLQANDERQRARAQAQFQSQDASAPTGPPPGGPTLVYRHGLSDSAQAAARALAEQATARRAKSAADADNAEGLLGNPKLWSLVPGVGSAPVPLRMDIPVQNEYKASLKHAAADGFASGSDQDEFFKPIHMTRSYHEDMDRAAAFARGTPLK